MENGGTGGEFCSANPAGRDECISFE